MNCKWFRREIEEREAGRAASADVVAHLNVCPACRKFDAERVALRHLLADVERVSAPPDFDFRLRARMTAAGLTNRRSPRPAIRRFAPGFVALSAAALFALTLLALRFQQTPPTSADEDPNRAVAAKTEAGESISHEAQQQSASNHEAAAIEERTASERQARRADGAAESGTVILARQSGLSRRTSQAVVREPARRNSRAGHSAGAARSDFTAAVGGARLLSRGAGEQARASVPLAVPVNSSAQPLKIVLRDDEGQARVVSIKSVSFGAQEFGGRTSGRTRHALANPEGVW